MSSISILAASVTCTGRDICPYIYINQFRSYHSIYIDTTRRTDGRTKVIQEVLADLKRHIWAAPLDDQLETGSSTRNPCPTRDCWKFLQNQFLQICWKYEQAWRIGVKKILFGGNRRGGLLANLLITFLPKLSAIPRLDHSFFSLNKDEWGNLRKTKILICAQTIPTPLSATCILSESFSNPVWFWWSSSLGRTAWALI